MEKDIEEIVQCYDRFVDIVKEISMNAKEQIIKLKGTIIADELASDFSEIGMMYAKELLENEWLTQEQYTIAKSKEKNCGQKRHYLVLKNGRNVEKKENYSWKC